MGSINELINTITVSQLLIVKGDKVWSIGPDDTVFTALEKFADKNIGALLVMDGDRLEGILSERDYARKVILQGKSSMNTPVREIMTAKVITVSPTHTLGDCMEQMTNSHIRHLPVVQNDQVVGLISIGDIVKAVISQQEFVIEQLENYIAGERSQ
ncbi:MAG TPA: CBS domain-containing protein [Anaerolineales bacterium]|nr:CBS domain-containing protein [Anaerolineales bacterium]